MEEIKCKSCGQTFKSPAELQEHIERMHGVGNKDGDRLAAKPPNETRR